MLADFSGMAGIPPGYQTRISGAEKHDEVGGRRPPYLPAAGNSPGQSRLLSVNCKYPYWRFSMGVFELINQGFPIKAFFKVWL